MSARAYLDGLILTHEAERANWPEPQWTAYLCLLNLASNILAELERRTAKPPEGPCSRYP